MRLIFGRTEIRDRAMEKSNFPPFKRRELRLFYCEPSQEDTLLGVAKIQNPLTPASRLLYLSKKGIPRSAGQAIGLAELSTMIKIEDPGEAAIAVFCARPSQFQAVCIFELTHITKQEAVPAAQ